MSTRTPHRPTRHAPRRRAGGGRAARAAQASAAGSGSLAGGRRRPALVVALADRAVPDKAVQEITLPLRHEDIIRQQAATRASTRR